VTHLIVVDDMGYVLLLPGEQGKRLPRTGEVEVRADRRVGRYGEAEVYTAPLDDDVDGDFFDPVDLPDDVDRLARAAVSDLVRGQYDVERDDY
jgi:hypothetical protein